jgi:transposase
MANKTITMLQLRRVIQLKEKGLSNRQIKKHLNLYRKTIDEYVNRVKQTGKSYKDLLKLGDEALGLLLFQQPQNTVASEKYNDLQSRLPGYVNELTNSKATRIILWEEYRQQVSEDYSRSQFCEHLSRYLQSRKAVMHIEHEPAELTNSGRDKTTPVSKECINMKM